MHAGLLAANRASGRYLVTPAAIKPSISHDDLEKLDVRVGTILKVEEISGADKLTKLTVDLDDMTRTVLAGIKGERDDSLQIEGK